MAITTSISKPVGWARTDVIFLLEDAFSWMGLHSGTVSGIVTGISSYSGGGTVVGSNLDYEDVFQISSSGIGTGASFYIDRQSGIINGVYVNRPGIGYTNGEVVQISSEDIGGSSNGAVGMAVTVLVAGGASPVGYGSTNLFYDKDVTAASNFPFGVLRNTVQSNKKFGNTYRVFQVVSANQIDIHVGSDFFPWDTTNSSNRGGFGANRFCGTSGFDITDLINGAATATFSSSSAAVSSHIRTAQFGLNNSYRLDLNIYKSTIDPKFAVFSFRHPTLSSLKLRDNTYFTFILHNYVSNIWDYDNVFLSGITSIIPNTDENVPYLLFNTYYGHVDSNARGTKRAAEFGYYPFIALSNTSMVKSVIYGSTSFPTASYDARVSNLYVRNNASTSNRGSNNGNGTTLEIKPMPSSSNFNAVIKGIPINSQFVPVPYYIPDDFVLIDFDYASASANIQPGDTITISGSEVYTVISGSYNQTTRTRGILFCARTV